MISAIRCGRLGTVDACTTINAGKETGIATASTPNLFCCHGNQLGYIVSVVTTSEREAAASRLVGKLMNIGALLERGTNQLLVPYGLNHQQFSILFEISRAGKVQQKDMINRLLLERAHVSKVVKKLESMGLLEVAPHPDDGRSSWLSVSTKGRALVQNCQRLFDVQKKAWFRRFDTQELLQILDKVSALQGAFSGRDEATLKTRATRKSSP